MCMSYVIAHVKVHKTLQNNTNHIYALHMCIHINILYMSNIALLYLWVMSLCWYFKAWQSGWAVACRGIRWAPDECMPHVQNGHPAFIRQNRARKRLSKVEWTVTDREVAKIFCGPQSPNWLKTWNCGGRFNGSTVMSEEPLKSLDTDKQENSWNIVHDGSTKIRGT